MKKLRTERLELIKELVEENPVLCDKLTLRDDTAFTEPLMPLKTLERYNFIQVQSSNFLREPNVKISRIHVSCCIPMLKCATQRPSDTGDYVFDLRLERDISCSLLLASCIVCKFSVL